MKLPKVSHETIVSAFRIVGVIFFLYSVYQKLKQIISLCNVKPKTKKKSVEIDEKLGIIKSIRKETTGFPSNVTY